MAVTARPIAWLDVANRALASLGQSRVENLDEGTQSANYCRLYLEEAIDYIASYHPWRCTRERIQLSRDGTTPVSHWTYRYHLPEDFLTLARDQIGNPLVSGLVMPSLVDFDIEGEWLMSNALDVWIVYHKTPATPDGYPPAFIRAITYTLAERLATILTSNDNLRALSAADAQKALAEAVKVDSASTAVLPAETERGYEFPDEVR